MKRRLLFVDDEPNLLAGLQRMLRPLRDEWDMEFVSSGADALAALQRAPVDVLVTDLRMPGMNGAELLQETARRFPQTTRIILSGYADKDLTLESLTAAHQFLAKPCNPDVLRAAVARALDTDAWLPNENIKRLVARMTSIPSIPTVYFEVMRRIQEPDSSLESIAQVIARDQGMTAKVLQLVNSAFFGAQRRIASPAEAVLMLGLETVKSLVLWVHIFSQYQDVKVEGFSLEKLSRHSLTTGRLAREIVLSEKGDQAMGEEAMTAGLLHDIGKLVLALNLPGPYGEVRQLAAAGSLALTAAERERFGATHAEIGAYLLSLWGLPGAIVDAVALHHTPGVAKVKTFSPLTAVHAANVIEREFNGAEAGAPGQLDLDYLASLNFANRLDAWRALTQTVEAQPE